MIKLIIERFSFNKRLNTFLFLFKYRLVLKLKY